MLRNKILKSPNQFATIAKNQVTIGTNAVNSSEKKTQPEITRAVPTIATIIMVMVKQTLTPTKKVSNNTNANSTNNQKDRGPRPVYPPCETCGKTNPSTEKCYFGANAANQNAFPE